MNIKKIALITITIIAVISACVSIPKSATNNQDIETAANPSIAKLRANATATFEGFASKEADALRDKIINSKNTEEVYDITGKKYYISVTGNDENDGLSPEKPIKSLWRLREIHLKYGDAVLFKRGDIFRFGESLKLQSNITYGSYGEGVKPRIYGSPKNYAQNDTWEKVSENIWKISFPYPEACGLRHLAFRVENIDEAVAWLESRGVGCEPIRVDEFTLKRMTFFHDPDGLPLELHE